MTKDHPIYRLINQRLIEVDFVLDYIRLSFESSSEKVFLTFLTDPIIKTNEVIYEKKSIEFSFMLISLINSLVNSIEIIEKEKMEITFDKGNKLYVSLRPEDYVTSEAVSFENSNKEWDVW